MFSGLFQPMHLLVILIIVLIVYGPGKLPDLGNSLGKAIREFKSSVDDRDSQTGKAEVKKIEGPQEKA